MIGIHFGVKHETKFNQWTLYLRDLLSLKPAKIGQKSSHLISIDQLRSPLTPLH